MQMLVSWIVFPLLLVALSFGCGLLLERAAGLRFPGPLIPSVGLAVVIVAAHFATLSDATADLAAPLVVALATAGFALALPGRGLRLDGWALAASAGVFLALSAPFVLSGENTFGGYIKLDDTASWLAITDRVMHHGAGLGFLPPSSYEATLDFYLNSHYPVGGFLPLGVGGVLLGKDLAWLYQPFLALLVAMLALTLYSLVSRVIDSAPLRASAVFVASQPALLFGYALWGGFKELATAWLLALTAALVPTVMSNAGSLRRVFPLALAGAAMIAVVSFGGALWLAPVLIPTLALVWLWRGRAWALRYATAFAAFAVVLSIPSIRTIDFLAEPAASTITNESRLANLIQPLSGLQLFGIWPVGDFRLRPDEMDVTYILVAVVVVAGLPGLYWAIKRRAWALLAYLSGAGLACLAITTFASPWVEAKALAIASPAFVLMALAGAIAVFASGRLTEAIVIGAAITGGVFWSNALAYRDVSLAPGDRFEELRQIGERISGEGPTLMTDYEPYGVRYFLRDADPEGASEYRRRVIPLRSGKPLDKLEFADIDDFKLDGLLAYRTMVLRRSPVASRPPSSYTRTWSGRYYDVWQRPERLTQPIREHLPLGDALDPAAVPNCDDILRLARLAGADGFVAGALSPPKPIVVSLSESSHPPGWRTYGNEPGSVYPSEAGTAEAQVEVPASGRYLLWVRGAFRSELDVLVDDRVVWSGRHNLSHSGHYVPTGEARLRAGMHTLSLRYRGADLHPGSGGRPFSLGPVALTSRNGREQLTYLRAGKARSLCGRRLDWVEALGA